MKWADLKIKNNDELKELMSEKRAELHSLIFQARSQQLKQVHKIKEARKAIAKLKMMMEQRKQEEK